MSDQAARRSDAAAASGDGAQPLAALGSQRPRLLTGESVALLLLGLVGAYLAISSFGLGLRTNGAWVAPGTMPLAVGTPLCLIAVVRLIGLAKAGRAPVDAEPAVAEQQDDDRDIFGRTAAQRVRQLWIVIAALAVAIALVPLLGFPVAFGALVFFIATVVERQRLLVAGIVTAVSLLAVHLIFVKFLGVPLPNGLLGGVFLQ